MKVSGAYI